MWDATHVFKFDVAMIECFCVADAQNASNEKDNVPCMILTKTLSSPILQIPIQNCK